MAGSDSVPWMREDADAMRCFESNVNGHKGHPGQPIHFDVLSRTKIEALLGCPSKTKLIYRMRDIDTDYS